MLKSRSATPPNPNMSRRGGMTNGHVQFVNGVDPRPVMQPQQRPMSFNGQPQRNLMMDAVVNPLGFNRYKQTAINMPSADVMRQIAMQLSGRM